MNAPSRMVRIYNTVCGQKILRSDGECSDDGGISLRRGGEYESIVSS